MGPLASHCALYLIVLAAWAICWATLARRLGYERDVLIGLLMAVPGVNLVTFLYLAFSESPNERRLREAGRLPAEPAEPARCRSEHPPGEWPEGGCPACGTVVPADAAQCRSCGLSLR